MWYLAQYVMVGLFFNWWIKKRFFGWWCKFSPLPPCPCPRAIATSLVVLALTKFSTLQLRVVRRSRHRHRSLRCFRWLGAGLGQCELPCLVGEPGSVRQPRCQRDGRNQGADGSRCDHWPGELVVQSIWQTSPHFVFSPSISVESPFRGAESRSGQDVGMLRCKRVASRSAIGISYGGQIRLARHFFVIYHYTLTLELISCGIFFDVLWPFRVVASIPRTGLPEHM